MYVNKYIYISYISIHTITYNFNILYIRFHFEITPKIGELQRAEVVSFVSLEMFGARTGCQARWIAGNPIGKSEKTMENPRSMDVDSWETKTYPTHDTEISRSNTFHHGHQGSRCSTGNLWRNARARATAQHQLILVQIWKNTWGTSLCRCRSYQVLIWDPDLESYEYNLERIGI